MHRYNVCAIGKDGTVDQYEVEGELIELQGMPGTYAVRQVTPPSDWWKVDHCETGFLVAQGDSREDAIKAALHIVETKGATGFEQAISKANQQRAEAGL